MIVYPPSRHGVYTQPGAKGVAGAQAFASWSGAPVHTVLDFAEHTRDWPQMTRHLPFEEWAQYRALGMRLVLSVGLVPGDPKTTPYTLAECAAGAYDEHFAYLGRELVAHDLGDIPLRLGWEFQGDWYPWSARYGREAVFAGAFRSAVTAFRSVEGEAFRFGWCGLPLIGNGSINFEAAYPGDEFVDYVGVDVYDADLTRKYYRGNKPLTASSHAEFWDFLLTGKWGLARWAQFARDHGKPLAIGEWGVTTNPKGEGGGDNPLFIDAMFDFIEDPARNVAWATYFEIDDANSGVKHALSTPSTAFPEAAARYRERAQARHAAEARLADLPDGRPLTNLFTTPDLVQVAGLIERNAP